KKQQENHVFGVIINADEYYATVEYKDSKGNVQTVDIDFPNGSNSSYKLGDKVKVANKDQWKQQKIYGKTVFYTDANSISKVNDES
ncbi:TPA: cell wall hydrolase, partial [Bacillus cereus]|nr:cell wall hydrolase [Bacillus cereus]